MPLAPYCQAGLFSIADKTCCLRATFFAAARLCGILLCPSGGASVNVFKRWVKPAIAFVIFVILATVPPVTVAQQQEKPKPQPARATNPPNQQSRQLQPLAQVDPTLLSSLHWRSIGPYRGGRTRAVSGVHSQPNVFYIG